MNNFSFMAFSSGKSSIASSPKRYIGIGTASVLAVNPTREELNKIYGNDSNTDPIVYNSTREIDGKAIPTARISFVIKLDAADNNGIDFITTLNFNLEKRNRVSMDGNKVQVIDEYGRTSWVTQDEFKTKSIPVYANGPAKISPNYRPILRGEENLVKFLKAFLSIDDIDIFNSTTNKFETNKSPNDCIINLEHIADYFNGNFNEIKEGIALQPDNKVKILFGVRHSDNNIDYQDFFNSCFLRARQKSIKMLKREFESVKSRGGYPNTDFAIDMISVYEGPVATKFEDNVTTSSVFEDDPFADKSNKDIDDLPFGF